MGVGFLLTIVYAYACEGKRFGKIKNWYYKIDAF